MLLAADPEDRPDLYHLSWFPDRSPRDLLLLPAAKAVVVACSPPNTLSWISAPPLPIRRIQWWFNLSAEGSGTKVVHECEVDLGEEARAMFGGTQGYNDTRGADVIAGMEKTLENLKGMF